VKSIELSLNMFITANCQFISDQFGRGIVNGPLDSAAEDLSIYPCDTASVAQLLRDVHQAWRVVSNACRRHQIWKYTNV